MKARMVGAALLCTWLFLASGVASAGTYGFDNLPVATAPPSGYAGITTWDDSFEVVARDCCGDSGYLFNNVSPNNEIFDYNERAELGGRGDPTFTLTSFYVGAAWNDCEDLQVVGLLDGVQVGNDNILLVISSTGPAQFVSLNWSGINEVDFSPYGGVNHGWNGIGEMFIIDDLCINGNCSVGTTTPEPPTIAMFGSGVCLCFGVLRRKTLA